MPQTHLAIKNRKKYDFCSNCVYRGPIQNIEQMLCIIRKIESNVAFSGEKIEEKTTITFPSIEITSGNCEFQLVH